MRDKDIRVPLAQELITVHAYEPEAVIVDEFGLCGGDVRVDLAVINGSLIGYEIKSDLDTLERLPTQRDAYNKVLDEVTVVAGSKHVAHVLSIVPFWWSIREARLEGGQVVFFPIRQGERNPDVDPFSLAQLLWRDEAIAVLSEFDLAYNVQRKPRRVLWQRLAEALSLAELGTMVRRELRRRKGWRVAL